MIPISTSSPDAGPGLGRVPACVWTSPFSLLLGLGTKKVDEKHKGFGHYFRHNLARWKWIWVARPVSFLFPNPKPYNQSLQEQVPEPSLNSWPLRKIGIRRVDSRHKTTLARMEACSFMSIYMYIQFCTWYVYNMLHTYFSLNCTIFTLIHSTLCINVNLLSSPLFHALATFLLWRIVLIYQQMVPAAPRKKTPQSPERQRACFRWSCHEWKRRTWANHWCAQQSQHTLTDFFHRFTLNKNFNTTTETAKG